MPKSKLFTVAALSLALLVSALWAGGLPLKNNLGDDRPVVQLSHPGRYVKNMPARDEDDFMTLRWMVSRDGAVNWSEIYGAGDLGMWEVDDGDTIPAWGNASYDFGAAVAPGNFLHFVVILNSFSDIRNPNQRVNGIYDVRVDMDRNVVINLIAAEGNDHFAFSDVGIDQQGNLYAVWSKIISDSVCVLMASKSTNNGAAWSNPIQIAAGLAPGSPYTHITYHVAQHFYAIFLVPNTETGVYDHKVAKMAATMQGNPEVINLGAASMMNITYYIGSSNPIDQDWNNGQLYFAVRSENHAATIIGSSTGGEWTLERIPGAQRYPSIGLDQGGQNGMPFVFSNFGVPAPGGYHKNWYSYDESGYGGGNWIIPPLVLDSLLYDGARDLLYCHQGVWTSSGRLVSGCNVWGQFTPEGFQVNHSDNNGETWANPQKLWSIFDDGLMGGYIAQNIIVPGFDNAVFVAFCGQYGETDFDGPDIAGVTLSSFALGQPWIVTANVSDPSGIGYTDCNWTLADSMSWEYAEADSGNVDDEGNGMYYYTMPSDTMNGRALANGDSIWFFIYAQDALANDGFGYENLIIVGQGWTGVSRRVEIPAENSLGMNYPNPFNSSTVIPFALSHGQFMRIQVWDTNGRLVATLFDGRTTAGRHEVIWKGEGAPSGIYLYTLETSRERFVGKMTLIK